jgi:hypothetical protein
MTRWNANSLAAGFARMRVADAAFLAHGIFWPEPWPVPVVAHA